MDGRDAGDQGLRTRQRRSREEHIVRTTSEMIAARGCGSLTMEEVAARLGTSKAVLYRYFGGREALFRRAVEHALAAAVTAARDHAATDASLRARAVHLVDRWLRVSESPDPEDAATAAPCCLSQVVCPYADWDATGKELAADIDDPTIARWASEGDFLRSLRALTAVKLHTVRAQGRTATPDDARAIVDLLLPSNPG